MFLVKREESRSFDVCFGCFLVFGRDKKHREELGREKILEKCVSLWFDGCLRLFIALGAFFEAVAIQGPPASGHP